MDDYTRNTKAQSRELLRRLNMGFRLANAERDMAEAKPRRNDTGLDAGRDATGCVFSFMQMPHNTRLD
jgi:hypothetical protein